MTIAHIGDSPSGQLLHGNHKDKTNELVDAANIAALEQMQAVYFSLAGSDLGSGLNVNSPKRTIQAATSAADSMNPSELNQIAIFGLDGGDYTGDVDVSEWVHLYMFGASLDGRLTVSDNSTVNARRLQNSANTENVIRKAAGTGFAKVTVLLLKVDGAAQDGLSVNAGTMNMRVGVLAVDAGTGIKARGGSRISFNIDEVMLSNGGLGIGTRLTTGAANSYSGDILSARDDGSGVLFETGVDGDVFNIQGGSFIVDTLYDLGVNSALKAFATEASGDRIADASAKVNLTLAGNGQQTISRDSTTQVLSQHNGLEATETVINFGTMTTQDFDIVAGEVEVLSVMNQVSCSLEIHLVKVGAQDAEFDIWLEASGDGGSTWFAIADSLRREVIDKDGSSNFVSDFSFNVSLQNGGKFRIVATNNGANTLSMQKPADIVTANGGATGFAKTIRLVKIR